jgi:itaconate CoA-transferase
VEIDSPVGALPALLPPTARTPQEVRMDPVPALGEHTEALLGELGFEAAAIARLREQEVI